MGEPTCRPPDENLARVRSPDHRYPTTSRSCCARIVAGTETTRKRGTSSPRPRHNHSLCIGGYAVTQRIQWRPTPSQSHVCPFDDALTAQSSGTFLVRDATLPPGQCHALSGRGIRLVEAHGELQHIYVFRTGVRNLEEYPRGLVAPTTLNFKLGLTTTLGALSY